MASSVSCGYAAWMDGETWNGLLGKTFHIAASFLNTPNSGPAQIFGGVLPSGGALFVSAGSGMHVSVNTGYVVVPDSTGSTFGGYLFGLLNSTVLDIATSDPTNPRVDLVCAYVNDVGTSSSDCGIKVVTGVPAAIPSAPSTPADCVAIATVRTPAGATSIVAGDITDVRTFTTAIGGIAPALNLGAAPAGYLGHYVHDRSTGRLVHNPSTGPRQASLLPFAPQIALHSANVSGVSTEQGLCTVTITCDGVTDIEITARFVGISIAGGSGNGFANMNVYLDSALLCQVATANQAFADSVARGGFTISHVTSGAGSDTPSAGTHTVSFKFFPHYDGTHQVTVPCSQSPAMLYVKPVCL